MLDLDKEISFSEPKSIATEFIEGRTAEIKIILAFEMEHEIRNFEKTDRNWRLNKN
jgi:hypothetical protein